MPKKKKKKQPAKHQGPMRWEFDSDIPTDDFFEGRSLDDMGALEEAVDSFVYMMNDDRFLTWEAVVREEQELRLTAKHKKALGELLDFSDEEDAGILYINESPRPSEPWYVILNKITSHLLIEPFRNSHAHYDVMYRGWSQIVDSLRKHGEGLSLPPGVETPEEVVPADVRRKLELQWCFLRLGSLDQDDRLEQVKYFVEDLQQCKESVAYFELSLDSLTTRLNLPERNRSFFVEELQKKLALTSAQELIASHL